jgi:hypothetical protein
LGQRNCDHNRLACKLGATHLGLILDLLHGPKVDVALDDRHPVDGDVLDGLTAESRAVDVGGANVVAIPRLALGLRFSRALP